MRPAGFLLVLVGALLLAGCGGGGKESTESTTTTTTTPVAEKTNVRVYWLRDGKVWPVEREVKAAGGVVNGTIAQLLIGPTSHEQKELAAKTGIPDDVTRAQINVDSGVATVKLFGASLPRAALAQLVYTLTQFPTVDSVVLGNVSYDRATFEDVTPAILVESPLAFDEVASPLHAKGTADTFEATFDYELEDSAGKILAHHFVTATTGNGMRGTFRFRAPFTIARSGPGTLTVFEVSAENGNRIHLVEIPLQLQK